MRLKGNTKKINRLIMGINWIPFVFGLGIVLELLLTLIGKGSGLGGVSNMLVMVSFFLIAGGIYFLSYRYLSDGLKIKGSLEKAKLDIRELATSDIDILKELTKREKVFADKNLNNAFNVFKEELNRMKEVGKGDEFNIESKIDIENYINEDLVDTKIHASFLNQIPSTLTGLGILGTFLGLSISLNSFDLTGSAADIEANVGPLMDGIKVAFHTSICGLCFSIMYNFFYHRTRSSIIESLDNFLEVFQEEVIPSTDNGSANTFLKYQAMICKELDRQIGLEEEIIKKQDDKFLNLANKLDEQNKQTLDVYREISEKISESQVKGIQEVVTSFVEEMNKSLGNSFKEIQVMVESIHNHEQRLQDKMTESLDKICDMSDHLGEINSSLSSSVEKIGTFMDDTSTMQKLLSDNIIKTKETQKSEFDHQRELDQRQTELMKKLGTLEEKVGKSVETQTKKITDICSKQEKQIKQEMDGFAAGLNKMETNFNNAVKQGISSISEVADKACNQLSERSVLEIGELGKATQDEIKKVSEIVEMAENETKDSILQLNQSIDVSVQSINELVNSIKSEVKTVKKEDSRKKKEISK